MVSFRFKWAGGDVGGGNVTIIYDAMIIDVGVSRSRGISDHSCETAIFSLE